MLKESFKYYKRKCPPPSLEDVLDFSDNDVTSSRRFPAVQSEYQFEERLGLKPVTDWKIFGLPDKPGLIFIPNPFLPIGQRYWIRQCLMQYTRRPSRLNLDLHGTLKCNEEWWTKCQSSDKERSSLIHKLRWATLGYHHNWDSKEYEECYRDNFPEDLAFLSKQVASALGFSKFLAEAAIVNYYPMDSSLSCHTDHSELNLEAPLLSFSFGQSAVFLVGGKSRNEKPIAVMIHSGDIVVMSGESRLFYHGIPLILPAKSSPWDDRNAWRVVDYDASQVELNCGLTEDAYLECNDDILWKPFSNYISRSRINMNVRQVLPNGQSSL